MLTPSGSGASLSGKRALVVTTIESPAVAPIASGMSVVSDLTGAGLPFDVVSYDRFGTMNSGDYNDHDIVFLNGHTSPVSAQSIARKCQYLIKTGRKIFINGSLPYAQYDQSGRQVDHIDLCKSLFGVSCRRAWTNGKALVPDTVEKDPLITSRGHFLKKSNAFLFRTPPELKITMGRHIVGFLTSAGGAIDGSSDYLLNLLDYGKVAGFLRYGHGGIVGFANDRINGRPIVSIEVHCDVSKNCKAIDYMEEMANAFGFPLSNLLVFSRNSASSIQRWNKAAENPLMLIGSHSRTHPKSWPQVADFRDETTGALIDQRKSIPKTLNYFNFSGLMNPTTSQIDALYQSGTLFGAEGKEPRMLGLPFDRPLGHFQGKPVKHLIWRLLKKMFPPLMVQIMPTAEKWYLALAQSNITPYCLSHTLWSDFNAIKSQKSYDEQTKSSFFKNIKNGMYSFGVIHDYSFDRRDHNDFQTNGRLLRHQIRDAFAFFSSQKVAFISTALLINRLRDFIGGWIAYTSLPDDRLQVTVHRKSAQANQVKIERRGPKLPKAAGDSVISQKLCGNLLYVDLKTEQTSTFEVVFTQEPKPEEKRKTL